MESVPIWQRWGMVGSAFLLVAFVSAKAFLAAFTHDESLTYLGEATHSWLGILSLDSLAANNHVLNTLVVKLVKGVLPHSPGWLRLGNVVLLPLFLWSAYQLARRCGAGAWPAFIVLTTNPFVLDYFALARGYGMAMAFSALSLVYLVRSFEEGSLRHYVLALLVAGLAVAANLVFLQYAIALLAVGVMHGPAGWRRLLGCQLGYLVCLGLWLWGPISKLKAAGALYFGGYTGFWSDTVLGTALASIYGLPYPSWLLWRIRDLLVLAMVVSVASTLRAALQVRRHRVVSTELVLGSVFWCMPVFVLVQTWLTQSPVPLHRTALFLVFPFIASFLMGWWSLKWLGVARKVVLWVLALWAAIHLSLTIDLHRYSTWPHDAGASRVVEDLEQLSADRQEPVSVGASWELTPSLNFYRRQQGGAWLRPFDREGFGEDDDFIYVYESQLTEAQAFGEVVVAYPDSGTYLLKVGN